MKRRKPYMWLSRAAALLGVLGVLAVGIWFYSAEERHLWRNVEMDLQAIAQLKADQVVAWRAERLADAAVLMENPFFCEGVRRWMADPQGEVEEWVHTQFRSLCDHYHYCDVELMDASGQVLFSAADPPHLLPPDATRALAAAFCERKPILCDPYISAGGHAPHLAIVAPLLAGGEQTLDPAVAVVFQIDCEQSLQPLIGSWPVPSHSAEAVLVRRNGDATLLLSDLRHRPDTAHKLRIPLSQTDVPIITAALGREGVVQGKDYRGVEVLSVMKAVPNSSWFVVAKEDLAEALSVERFASVLLLGLVLAAAVVVAAGVGVLWERNQKNHFRSLLEIKEELHASQQIVEGIMNAIPVRVFWKDKNLVYLGCNASFAGDAGFADPKDIIGKTDHELVWRDQAELYRSDDRQVIQSGCPKLQIEEPQTTPEGNLLILLTSKTPLLDAKGETIGVLGTYMDITERKRAEVQQTRLLRKLSEVNRELKDFAHVVSHDLKAPLRAIKTLADWLCTDYQDTLDEEGRNTLRLLNNRVDRMHGLIDGILRYSRIARTEQAVEPVDLNRLLSEIVESLGVPEHISVEVQADLPTIEADETRIAQVFQNLLGNAIKYMDKPQGRIAVACAEEDGFWRFSVTDNGPGIEEKHFDRIFRLFQTLAPRDEFESTGVGLALVKKIVEMYGGRIWVESQVGEGSAFLFTFARMERGRCVDVSGAALQREAGDPVLDGIGSSSDRSECVRNASVS